MPVVRDESNGDSEVGAASGPAIEPEVIPELTEAARRLAEAHEDRSPRWMIAVATGHAKALEVVLGYGPSAIADKPVYVVAIKGRFKSYRGGMASRYLTLRRIS